MHAAAAASEYFRAWSVTNCITVTHRLMAHRNCDVSGKFHSEPRQHNRVCINILSKGSGITGKGRVILRQFTLGSLKEPLCAEVYNQADALKCLAAI